jgi:hypothetical protein
MTEPGSYLSLAREYELWLDEQKQNDYHDDFHDDYQKDTMQEMEELF